jgi:hypothetical protein
MNDRTGNLVQITNKLHGNNDASYTIILYLTKCSLLANGRNATNFFSRDLKNLHEIINKTTMKGDNINTQKINEILAIKLKEVLRNLESNDVAQQTLNNYCDSSTVEICHKCKRICRSTAVYLFESTLGSL